MNYALIYEIITAISTTADRALTLAEESHNTSWKLDLLGNIGGHIIATPCSREDLESQLKHKRGRMRELAEDILKQAKDLKKVLGED